LVILNSVLIGLSMVSTTSPSCIHFVWAYVLLSKYDFETEPARFISVMFSLIP